MTRNTIPLVLLRCLLLLPPLSFAALSFATSPTVEEGRHSQSLDGAWRFQREGAGDAWKTVTLPNSFEEHEGVEFDGVGIYRKTIPHVTLAEGRRAILRFEAAATDVEVWFDGKQLGSHLGGWTPFSFDVTELIRAKATKRSHEIRVRVDEKVGHNSQGFLPIVCPHFGGIWQGVQLLTVPETWIDDAGVLAIGDTTKGKIRIELPLRGSVPDPSATVDIRYRLLGEEEWSARRSFVAKPHVRMEGPRGTIRLELPVPDWKWWSPREPNLYELDICLNLGATVATRDRVSVRAAFRTIEAKGHSLLLNGKPLSVRGLLNWGYAPPRVAPSIDEAHMLRDMEIAQARGFNLMKFCLWVPPKRYLELADEAGMLTWMEYPTWHSKWSKDQLPTLRKEFAEFFRYDRNHPSVVLRSLTCETGPSADLDVIRTLYDMCHEMIPGSVVEDDSSWIAWNRVHDFYDDHPYGNNHTWVATLDRLKEHIAEREAKPLVLGEAICADTWIDHAAIRRRAGAAKELPFWAPVHFDDTLRWTEKIRDLAGPEGLDRLYADSLRYGLLMRKYQIETFRREVPKGGYVVSVIRDFRKASMGLIDFAEQVKWSPRQWCWHRETLCILKTLNDRRSFATGEPIAAELLVSHFGDAPLDNAEIELDVVRPDGDPPLLCRRVNAGIAQDAGTLEKVLDLRMPAPDVDQPMRLIIRATLRDGQRSFVNQWPIWIVPQHISSTKSNLVAHDSCPTELLHEQFPDIGRSTSKDGDAIVLTSRLDGRLMDHLESGGRVLLLADGEKGSFPTIEHWFLKGAPYVSGHPLTKTVSRDMLVELQHFDLAGPVIPRIEYLEQLDPVLMLWDTHDIDHVATHGLLFETRVGRGRLLVSALRHSGEDNAVGRWLLGVLLEHLRNGPKPRHALSETTRRQMREKLFEAKLSLVETPWRFAVDGDNAGLKKGWHLPTVQDSDWDEIRIGQAWEGQGYPRLDGWAWYRISVEVPPSWEGRSVYVSFEGVDDQYELYVNGKLAGSGGDVETKQTAFEERKSHAVTHLVTPGETVTIAVRVCDWQGSGGLFRPVTVGTTQLGGGADVLK